MIGNVCGGTAAVPAGVSASGAPTGTMNEKRSRSGRRPAGGATIR